MNDAGYEKVGERVRGRACSRSRAPGPGRGPAEPRRRRAPAPGGPAPPRLAETPASGRAASRILGTLSARRRSRARPRGRRGRRRQVQGVADKRTRRHPRRRHRRRRPARLGRRGGRGGQRLLQRRHVPEGQQGKGCELADPASLAAKIPPGTCTVHLDDGVQPCAAWISGCTPGPRDIQGLDQCVEVSSARRDDGHRAHRHGQLPGGPRRRLRRFRHRGLHLRGTACPTGAAGRRRHLEGLLVRLGQQLPTNYFRATAVCCPP